MIEIPQRELHVFDFDETIVDDYWLEHVNVFLVKLGKSPVRSHAELTSRFYAEEEIFTDPAEFQEFVKFFEKQTPYVNTKPRDGSFATLSDLNHGRDVLIATALPDILSKEYQQKEACYKKRFVQKEFPFLDADKQLIFTRDKKLMSGTSITDDTLSNLAGNFKKKLLFNAHHNVNFDLETLAEKDVTRVYNWREIGDILLEK